MVRRIMMIGIALIGFTLALGSNAWADRDRGDRGHRNDRGSHQQYKNPPGNHYGWGKGNGNLHRDWHYRDHQRHRYYKGYPQRKQVVEKHVYHHYPTPQRSHYDHFNIAVSVIDDYFGFGMVVSQNR